MNLNTSLFRQITLSVVAFVAFNVQLEAQIFTTSSAEDFTLKHNPENNVLFEQQSGGMFGAVSSHSDGLDMGVYGSDDFILAEDSQITSVTVSGYQTEGNLDVLLLGLKLYIYPDDANSTQPAGNPTVAGDELFGVTVAVNDPALSMTSTVNSNETVYTFTVDVSSLTTLNLDANTRYWLVVAPVLDSEDIEDEDLHWNWYLSSTANTTDSMIIDPDDLSSLGITDWTSLSDLGVPLPQIGFAMVIEGIPDGLSLGSPIKDSEISIFPNPTRDYIQLQYSSQIEITQVEVYNVLGKKMDVNFNNDIINLSNFASGVYFLTIETTQGQLTKKLIKK